MTEVDPEEVFEKNKAGKTQEDFDLVHSWNWGDDFERRSIESDSEE